MWIFIIFFFSITFIYTVMHLSLAQSKKVYGIALFSIAIVPLVLYRFSAQQTNQTLEWISNQPSIVSGIAMLQVFEGFLMLCLTVLQLKGYFTPKFLNWTAWITLFPSAIFLSGLFFLQTYLFLAIDNIPYSILAFSFVFALILILLVSIFLVKKTIKDWNARLEIKALIIVFQLLSAMFLPLIAKGNKVTFSQITIEFIPILFTASVIFALVGIGYFIYKRNNNSIS